MNFAIMVKFIPATLGLLETLQLPNGFIKGGPPTHFHSTPITLPLSRPCHEPSTSALRSYPEPQCPQLAPCTLSRAQQSEPRTCAITALRPAAAEPSAAHCRCCRALSLLPSLGPSRPCAPESTTAALPSALHFTCSAPVA